MIRAVYILQDSGVPIFMKNFDPSLSDPILVSSFITAINSFSHETTGKGVKSIDSHNLILKIADFESILVVTISDNAEDVEDNLLDTIAIKFLSKYATELDDNKDRPKHFDDFSKELDRLIPIGEKEEIINPQEPLDAISLVELPENLRKIALIILEMKEIQINQLAERLNISKSMASKLLKELFDSGKIGKKTKGRQITYFI